MRPPADWLPAKPNPPAVIAFAPIDRTDSPAGLEVKHLHTGNPTPLKRFVEEAKPVFQQNYKGADFLEEKELTIGGRPAYRIVFAHGKRLEIKTVIPRSNLEFYLVDAWLEKDDAPKLRPVLEASVASFRIVPRRLTAEERVAMRRTLETLRAGGIRKSMLGETWHAIHISRVKTGHMRTRLSEANGRYAFELDVVNDFGKGGKDTTKVRGEFAADGSYQKIERERTKVNPKKKWIFKAKAEVKDGRATVRRDMNGYVEERTLEIGEGVFLTDVAEIVRGLLVTAGAGDYVIRTLSPFSDTPNLEAVEVTRPEETEVNGENRKACIVFAVADRRKNRTYTYGPGGTLLRQGGSKDLFTILAATKEEALKK